MSGLVRSDEGAYVGVCVPQGLVYPVGKANGGERASLVLSVVCESHVRGVMGIPGYVSAVPVVELGGVADGLRALVEQGSEGCGAILGVKAVGAADFGNSVLGLLQVCLI